MLDLFLMISSIGQKGTVNVGTVEICSIICLDHICNIFGGFNVLVVGSLRLKPEIVCCQGQLKSFHRNKIGLTSESVPLINLTLRCACIRL